MAGSGARIASASLASPLPTHAVSVAVQPVAATACGPAFELSAASPPAIKKSAAALHQHAFRRQGWGWVSRASRPARGRADKRFTCFRAFLVGMMIVIVMNGGT